MVMAAEDPLSRTTNGRSTVVSESRLATGVEPVNLATGMDSTHSKLYGLAISAPFQEALIENSVPLINLLKSVRSAN